MVWTIPEEGRSASGHIGKGKLRRVKVNALRAETNKPLNECNWDLSPLERRLPRRRQWNCAIPDSN
jgi:hypothetical protein